jgi:O-antigen/teichoic acid export membrane protein
LQLTTNLQSEAIVKRAAIASAFNYAHFAMAFVVGVVLFPATIRSVGIEPFGWWLAAQELTGFVVFLDLGVYSVVPFLLAKKIAENDERAIGTMVSDSVCIGIGVAIMLAILFGIWAFCGPRDLSLYGGQSKSFFVSASILWICYIAQFPIKVFPMILNGYQDVVVAGALQILQSALTIAITIWTIVSDVGVMGLALAAGLPPILVSCLALLRVHQRHLSLARWGLPTWRSFAELIYEGAAIWVSGIGHRLLVSFNGTLFTLAGRPDLATIYAGTTKLPTVLLPLATNVPDSALIGLGHIRASDDHETTKRTAICLLVLYFLLSCMVAIFVMAANPAFVTWWLGPELFAGTWVNVIVVLGVMVAGFAGGCFKMAAAIARRWVVGVATLVAGILQIILGLGLIRSHQVAGLPEASIIVWTMIILPVGIWIVATIFHLRISDLKPYRLVRLFVVTMLAIVFAAWIGHQLQLKPLLSVLAAGMICLIYGWLLIPHLKIAPWPNAIRKWLDRFALIRNP